jgi:outer membrane protein assembly factor BamA
MLKSTLIFYGSLSWKGGNLLFISSGVRPVYRGILAFVLFATLILPAAALADTELIPLPVYATTRNGGDDMGFMPVFMFKEKSEYVYGIFAPSYIYNGNTGTNLTLRYLGYPSIDRNYRIFINRSLGVDQEYTVEYWDDRFMGGKVKLFARATYFKDSTYRFFGLTESSREVDETNYTNNELSPEFSLGWYLQNNLVFAFGEKFRWVTTGRGKVTDLPFLKSRFRGLPGLDGGTVQLHRLSLTYDTRDDKVYPSEGWNATVYGEVGSVYSEGRTFTRAGFDARRYISSSDKRYTTVLRASSQVTGGKDVPFFEKSWIGGENTLRGFGNFRYRDDAFVLFNAEERIRLFKAHIFGVWSDWEVAPFIDCGRVYSSFSKHPFREFQVNPGIGFRAIVPPNVVGRVDFGYGKEGLTAFVGLDFPF